jgi:hypothetical protein
LPKPKTITVAGGGGRTRQIASYGGAQFWSQICLQQQKKNYPPKCPKQVFKKSKLKNRDFDKTNTHIQTHIHYGPPSGATSTVQKNDNIFCLK